MYYLVVRLERRSPSRQINLFHCSHPHNCGKTQEIPQIENTRLEGDVMSGLRGNSSHKVGGDKRPQDDRVLTRRYVRQQISVKVDGNQHDRHLTHLQ